jgi:predicted Rossmann-fold nucleotide-binding protein
MGVMADAALAADGEVIGVIPRTMITEECAHIATLHSLLLLSPCTSASIA